MRRIFILFLLLACSVSVFCSVAHAQRSDQGVWIRDNLSKCEVWAPAWATRSSISGPCQGGKAEGLASISLYLESTITDAYDGYFLSGYYIAPQKVDGLVSEAPIGRLFEISTGIERLKLYTLLQPRTKRSSACSETLYAAVNIQQVPLTGDNARRITDAFLPRYQALCASFGQDGSFPSLTVQFVPFTFFNSTNPPVYARATATWDGGSWRVTTTETTDLLGAPQRQTFGAAAIPQQAPTPAASPNTTAQQLQLTLAANVSSSVNLGYPVCQATIRLANRGRLDLNGFAILGTVYTAQRQPIANFRAARDNTLPVNAQITVRSNLPAAACTFIGMLQIAQISCIAGTQTIADCKPFIRFISDDSAAVAGTTVVPNVQITY